MGNKPLLHVDHRLVIFAHHNAAHYCIFDCCIDCECGVYGSCSSCDVCAAISKAHAQCLLCARLTSVLRQMCYEA